MLSKVRNYVKKSELKNIYYAKFESHIRYGCQIRFLSSSEKLQRKAIQIMSFSDLREPSSLLFKEWEILKIKDIVEIQNCHFVHSKKLPKSFENIFQKCNTIHVNPTRFSRSDCLYMPRFQSVTYGLNCITNTCIHSWNNLTKTLEKPSTLSITMLKKKMLNHCIANY